MVQDCKREKSQREWRQKFNRVTLLTSVENKLIVGGDILGELGESLHCVEEKEKHGQLKRIADFVRPAALPVRRRFRPEILP